MTAHISLTSWATPMRLSEREHEGKGPAAELHVVIPHGSGERMVTVEVSATECLALCANAADAARLLFERERLARPRAEA